MAIRFSPVVQDALDHGNAVVGLETGILTNALPRPLNFEVAIAIEDKIRSVGVVPATIGIVEGDAVIGLSEDELRTLCADESARRVAIRDLPVAETISINGGTSLAATIHLANRAGIKVCATTGLGGVYRAGQQLIQTQESSDLSALAWHPIVLVTAGLRPMLNLSATLSRLDEMNVPVLGYQTSVFPGFYVTETDYLVDWQVDSAAAIAEIAKARDELQLDNAILVANPIAKDHELANFEQHLEEAEKIADNYSAAGADDTQIMMLSLEEVTAGESWRVNIEIYNENVLLASEIAKALATTPHYTD